MALKWRSMALLVSVVGVLLITGAVLLAVNMYLDQSLSLPGDSTLPAAGSLAPGNPAPDFTLTSLEGVEISLSQLKGTPVVLNFWATWCPPCKEEMPLFEDYSQRYQGKFLVLAVDDNESKDLVQPFVDELSLTFPVLLDPGESVNMQYRIQGYPTTYFISADGKISSVHIGLLSEKKLKAYLKDLGVNF